MLMRGFQEKAIQKITEELKENQEKNVQKLNEAITKTITDFELKLENMVKAEVEKQLRGLKDGHE